MIDFNFDELFGTPVEVEDLAFDSKPVRLEKIGRAPRANAGIAAAYRRKLIEMIEAMATDAEKEIAKAYRTTPPEVTELAQDDLASEALRKVIRNLVRKWMARFTKASENLADYFATASADRTDAQLKKILKDGGFSVEWKMTRAQRDVLNSIVNENTALIKSIPQQYLGKVEGMVMRSVQTGRDLHQLTTDLQKQLGVEKRRAAFIARDQNNKASAMLQRARYLETNIQEAVWCHSSGGRTPRPSHVKASRDKERFNVAEGWADPALGGKRIWPGTEINCRCYFRPVLPGVKAR